MALTQVPNSMLAFDGGPLGMRNRIINGDMRIDQRNAGASVTINAASNTYTLDRWLAAGQATDGVFTVQQSATAPSGFSNSTVITVTTADSSIGATQAYYFRQNIEGYNVADLGYGTASAQTVTLSFWVRSSVTGTFGGALNNSAFNRSYPFSFTISAANTFEYKTITITGDTSGTWLTTNGIGFAVTWSLGMGSTYKGTASAWSGSLLLAPTGAVDLISTSGATFYVTGVQLEVGTVATPFERRLYGQELALCQRYYYRLTSQAAGDYFVNTAFAVGTTQAFGFSTFPVQMRTKPTALEQSGTATDYNVVRCGAGTNTNCSAVPTFGVANLNNAETVFTVASGLVNGGAGAIQSNNTSAYLGWSAEL